MRTGNEVAVVGFSKRSGSNRFLLVVSARNGGKEVLILGFQDVWFFITGPGVQPLEERELEAVVQFCNSPLKLTNPSSRFILAHELDDRSASLQEYVLEISGKGARSPEPLSGQILNAIVEELTALRKGAR